MQHYKDGITAESNGKMAATIQDICKDTVQRKKLTNINRHLEKINALSVYQMCISNLAKHSRI